MRQAPSAHAGDLWVSSEMSDQVLRFDSETGADSTEQAEAVSLGQQADEFWELIESSQPFFPQEFVGDLRMIREVADRWSEEVLSQLTQSSKRTGLVLAHHARVASHISGQDRRQSALCAFGHSESLAAGARRIHVR